MNFDKALEITFYAMWFVVVCLATKQAMSLLAGWSEWYVAIVTGFVTTVWKHRSDAQQLGDSERMRSVIRSLSLRCGGKIYSAGQRYLPTARDNLPLAVALEQEKGGLGEYLRYCAPASEVTTVLMRVGAYPNAVLLNVLEKLDDEIRFASSKVEGPYDQVTATGIRYALLREAAKTAGPNPSYERAMGVLKSRAGGMPLNSAARAYILSIDTRRDFHAGSWATIQSWLTQDPPETIDDLFGKDGVALG